MMNFRILMRNFIMEHPDSKTCLKRPHILKQYVATLTPSVEILFPRLHEHQMSARWTVGAGSLSIMPVMTGISVCVAPF